jgi:hypothetical protein
MNIDTRFENLGFELLATGGGCMAYIKRITETLELVITDELSAPTAGNSCTVSLMADGCGAPVLSQEFATAEAAATHLEETKP